MGPASASAPPSFGPRGSQTILFTTEFSTEFEEGSNLQRMLTPLEQRRRSAAPRRHSWISVEQSAAPTHRRTSVEYGEVLSDEYAAHAAGAANLPRLPTIGFPQQEAKTGGRGGAGSGGGGIAAAAAAVAVPATGDKPAHPPPRRSSYGWQDPCADSSDTTVKTIPLSTADPFLLRYHRLYGKLAEADECFAEGPGVRMAVAGTTAMFYVRTADSSSRIGKETLRLNLRSISDYVCSFVADPMMEVESYFEKSNSGGIGDTRWNRGGRGSSLTRKRVRCETAFQPEVVFDKDRYVVSYRIEEAGPYLLDATIRGMPISGSPYHVHIVTGDPCPRATKLFGPNLSLCLGAPDGKKNECEGDKGGGGAEEGRPRCGRAKKPPTNSFVVQVGDQCGNRVGVGGHSLSVKGKDGVKIEAVVDMQDGRYFVGYSLTVRVHIYVYMRTYVRIYICVYSQNMYKI
eukprot:GHVU01167353.1.p1 GENE.GHVU01167353.1~~GHVU01167353.1.p1  ORF type:complete len:482 (+),score=53.85 GHVU01167353.1:75-1448(+)